MTKVAELLIEGAHNIGTKTTFAHITSRTVTRAFGGDDRQKQDGNLFCYKWNRNLRGEFMLPRYVRTCWTCDFGRLHYDDMTWGLTGKEATADTTIERKEARLSLPEFTLRASFLSIVDSAVASSPVNPTPYRHRSATSRNLTSNMSAETQSAHQF
jgi:hypothetical protein